MIKVLILLPKLILTKDGFCSWTIAIRNLDGVYLGKVVDRKFPLYIEENRLS